jgi:hypothetical protein
MKHFEDVQTGGYFQYMYRFILSISLIISCCAVSLGEAPDVRFAAGKSALNLPLKIFNNHVYLQVSVNADRAPQLKAGVRLLIDK